MYVTESPMDAKARAKRQRRRELLTLCSQNRKKRLARAIRSRNARRLTVGGDSGVMVLVEATLGKKPRD